MWQDTTGLPLSTSMMFPSLCRFDLEDDVPVVYCYELQLEEAAQRKGLGKFLMQLLELIVSSSVPRVCLKLVCCVSLGKVFFGTFDFASCPRL
jgi:hypothetical protein